MLDIVFAAIGGLLAGGAASVFVQRIPRAEPLRAEWGRCPSCGGALSAGDVVPLVAWVRLRARCRMCGERIVARYPAIEVMTAALFAAAVAFVPRANAEGAHRPWDLVAYIPLFWMLVVLAFIDGEHRILPNRLVLPSVAAGAGLFGIAAAAGPGGGAWVRAILAGAACFAFFLALALISPAGMGMGDVKLAAVLGLALGYLGWGRVMTGFFLAFLAGSIVGVGKMLVRGTGRKTDLPFGPFLAAGTVAAILWGAPLQRALLGL